jgi:hypothetical protein
MFDDTVVNSTTTTERAEKSLVFYKEYRQDDVCQGY